MIKKVMTAAVCVTLFVVLYLPVCAEEIISHEEALDVTFVVDCSGSMKTNDRGGMGREMVKAFVDTVHAEDIRVGYVAYSDKVVSSVSPVPVSDPAKRQNLKELIDTTEYTGDTDIGLGLSYAYELMPAQEGRRRIIVLISDGETDLRAGGERTEEQSAQDLDACIAKCREEGIPVYTIAFGRYEGSKGTLERAAAETGAESYSAQNPQTLIEVLYGIFTHNLSYQIQRFSNGTYAGGSQEIRCILEETHLDEIDVLLVSSDAVGETVLRYGEKQIPMTGLSYYAVGKIGSGEINDSVRELTVTTSTGEGQSLQIFLVGYRKLVPVLEIDRKLDRNEEAVYHVYFRDRDGSVIRDGAYYDKFQWDMTVTGSGGQQISLGPAAVNDSDGVLEGTLRIDRSGTYRICGNLSDALGSYRFDTQIDVVNTPPSGSLPETRTDILKKPLTYDLRAYFRDVDGDELTFSIDNGGEGKAEILLAESELSIKALHAGKQTLTLFISDGEDTLSYPFAIRVVPLWQAYWWVIALFCAAVILLLVKILYRPKPELEQIAEKKAGNRFAGRMDAYVTAMPQDREEIPPLTFPMYRIRDSRVCVGDLMKEYEEISDRLELDQIFLIADEDRKMILYHSTSATVMIGGSIVCRQLQYSMSFGDIIYITSVDGEYELEIHYIAMIQ